LITFSLTSTIRHLWLAASGQPALAELWNFPPCIHMNPFTLWNTHKHKVKSVFQEIGTVGTGCLLGAHISIIELWRQVFHGWIVEAYTLTSVKYQPVCAGVNVFGLSVTQLKSTAN
jgi:hypothetical protein